MLLKTCALHGRFRKRSDADSWTCSSWHFHMSCIGSHDLCVRCDADLAEQLQPGQAAHASESNKTAPAQQVAAPTAVRCDMTAGTDALGALQAAYSLQLTLLM